MGQTMSGSVAITGSTISGTGGSILGRLCDRPVLRLRHTAALITRMQTGEGRHVEASLMGPALTVMNPVIIEATFAGRTRRRAANSRPVAGPSDVYATQDGWIIVQVIGDALFRRCARVVGAEHLIHDLRFTDDTLRGRNGQALSKVMGAWCATRTTTESLQNLERARIPAGPVLSPTEALAYAQERCNAVYGPCPR